MINANETYLSHPLDINSEEKPKKNHTIDTSNNLSLSINTKNIINLIGTILPFTYDISSLEAI